MNTSTTTTLQHKSSTNTHNDTIKFDLDKVLDEPPVFNHTAAELQYTPSRQYFTAAIEAKYRIDVCTFISLIGQKCSITQMAIAVASIYLHQYLQCISLLQYDIYEIGATCLFLAGKVEERRIRIDTIIDTYYKIRAMYIPDRDSNGNAIRKPVPTSDSIEFDRMRDRMYKHEELLLDCIEYQFDVKYPYTYLIHILKDKIYGPNYADACM